MHHLIHDMDRDGWGSAALLLATLGLANCKLHPVRDKNVGRVLADLPADDPVFVLDIPAPRDWQTKRWSPVTWVDHHRDSWQAPSPSWVHAVLPNDAKPTTTMRLLVQSGLVTLPTAMPFVAGLCRRHPPFEWGLVFDAMRNHVPEVENLAALLTLGPLGQPVPAALRSLLQETEDTSRTVESLLDAAPTAESGALVRIDLADAQRIPLARFSLAAEKRYPGLVRVLVHRHQRLYVSRDSRRPGIDLIAHFQGRGLDPKGHPYVCTLNIPANRIDTEIAAIENRQTEGPK